MQRNKQGLLAIFGSLHRHGCRRHLLLLLVLFSPSGDSSSKHRRHCLILAKKKTKKTQIRDRNSVQPDVSDRVHSSTSSCCFPLPPSRTGNRGRPASPAPLPHSSLPPRCWCHGSDPALRPSFSPVLFASMWDGSFIYAGPQITSLARLFVSRLNPAAVAAAAGSRMEALSPSPLENSLLPPINSTSRRISVNQASGPPDPSHRPANSAGFLDSDLAKTPGEWLVRNTAVVV